MAGLAAASCLSASTSTSSTLSSQSLSPHTNDPRKAARAEVILTDLVEVIPLLEKNIALWRLTSKKATATEVCNDDVQVRALPLPWGDREAALKVLDELEADMESGGGDERGKPGRSGLTHIVCSDLVSLSASSYKMMWGAGIRCLVLENEHLGLKN